MKMRKMVKVKRRNGRLMNAGYMKLQMDGRWKEWDESREKEKRW